MNSIAGGLSPRHVPQRTCIACREVKTKKELLRLVSAGEEGVIIDLGGNKPGRGAYLCPFKECWESGLKRDRLGYSLRTKLSPENKEKLIGFALNFTSRESKR